MNMPVAIAFAVSIFPALACGQTAPDPRPGASTPVQVMNSTANPVPVTGSTTVSGSVAATQSGAWTVNVAKDQTPFAKLLCLSDFGSCVTSVGGITSPELPHAFTVPNATASGKAIAELIVEFVSGDCIGTARTTEILIYAAKGAIQLADTGDNFSSNRIPVAVAQFNDTLNVNAAQSFAQRTHMRYPPGTTISMTFDIAKAGSMVCKAQLNGYFVTA